MNRFFYKNVKLILFVMKENVLKTMSKKKICGEIIMASGQLLLKYTFIALPKHSLFFKCLPFFKLALSALKFQIKGFYIDAIINFPRNWPD